MLVQSMYKRCQKLSGYFQFISLVLSRFDLKFMLKLKPGIHFSMFMFSSLDVYDLNYPRVFVQPFIFKKQLY